MKPTIALPLLSVFSASHLLLLGAALPLPAPAPPHHYPINDIQSFILGTHSWNKYIDNSPAQSETLSQSHSSAEIQRQKFLDSDEDENDTEVGLRPTPTSDLMPEKRPMSTFELMQQSRRTHVTTSAPSVPHAAKDPATPPSFLFGPPQDSLDFQQFQQHPIPASAKRVINEFNKFNGGTLLAFFLLATLIVEIGERVFFTSHSDDAENNDYPSAKEKIIIIDGQSVKSNQLNVAWSDLPRTHHPPRYSTPPIYTKPSWDEEKHNSLSEKPDFLPQY
ncbi:MAG: hypothetical protein M1819_007481 [Sarea resinae]|nr:MAG: hypothetical protein M1819_007481 [Sarea resinae]